jgi:hypothetical protein
LNSKQPIFTPVIDNVLPDKVEVKQELVNTNIEFIIENNGVIYSDDNRLVQIFKVTDPITKKVYLLVPGKGAYVSDGVDYQFRLAK